MSALLLAQTTIAQEETHESASTTASLTIEQKSVAGVINKFVILMPENVQKHSWNDAVTYNELVPGSYTIISEPPDGAEAKIRVYKDGTLEKDAGRQITLSLAAGEHKKVSIHYNFTRIGTVSLSSDPPGMVFRLEGPNRITITGETPESFDNFPVGQYSATFEPIGNCPTPPRQSNQLVAGSRITFHVKAACKEADDLRREQEAHSAKYITIIANGREVDMLDVPQDAWFASAVFQTGKLGILSGYTDENGNLTGEFGPSDNVTLAQLAKIAHRTAGLNESEVRSAPDNPYAQGTWFADFWASAEQRGWVAFRETDTDPGRPATRAEVISTLLQAMDIPVVWSKGDIFADVSWRTTPYASVIETAAIDTVVGGYVNDEGQQVFGPDEFINRAETAQMILSAVSTYRSEY